MSYTITYNLTNVASSNTSTTVEENTSYSTLLSTTGGNIRRIMSTVSVRMGGTNITSQVVTNVSERNRQIDIPSVTGDIVITANVSNLDYGVNVTNSFVRKGGDSKVDYNFDYSKVTFSTQTISGETVNYYHPTDYSNFYNIFTTQNPPTPSLGISGRVGMHGKENYGVKKSKIDNKTLDYGFNSICVVEQNVNDHYYAKCNGIPFFADIVTDINGDEWYKTAYFDLVPYIANWGSVNTFGGYNANTLNITGYGSGGLTLGLDDSIFEEYTPAPQTVDVTNNLTNCTTNNNSTTTALNGAYSATITANNSCEFDSSKVTVMMGNTSITPTFASDNKSFTISIASVTDDITITAIADRYYSIDIHDFVQSTSSNTATRIKENTTYTTTCTSNNGYFYDGHDYVGSHNATVWNTDTNRATVTYNDTHTVATFTIANVSADIVLHSYATNDGCTITNNLTNCITDNLATEVSRDNYYYTATLTANNGYHFVDVSNYSVKADNTQLNTSGHRVITLSNNNKTATIDTRSASSMATYGIYDLIIDVYAVPDSGYTITNNLTNCSTNNSSTTVEHNASYSATITATSGYYFESENVSVMMGNQTIVPTFASDNKSFTISIANATDNIVITASATIIPIVYHSVTNNLTNASNNNSATSVQESTSYVATITATSGYYFETSNVTVMMGNIAITPTYASDNKSFTISIASVTDDIVITASATIIPPQPTYYSVTNNLTNASNNNSATSVQENTSYVATITATSGYYFEHNNVTVMMGNTSITPIFASDDKSFTISIASVTDDIVITASATQSIIYHNITNTLNRCTNSNSATSVEDGVSYNATITANTDYHFESENVSVMMGNIAITPTYASDNKSFTISIASVTDDIVITASASSDEPTPVIVTDFGTCRVYNPTLSELSDMMEHTTDSHYQDRTNDIIRLYKTYVTIPVKSAKENIMLGDWNTTIQSDVVSQQYLTIDCGDVSLDEVNKNVIDYSPFTSLKIFLPFIGIEDVDIDVYRGKTVNLKYKFDVISGKCVAILSVNGDVYDQFESDIADEIPYTGKQTIVYTPYNQAIGRYNVTSRVTTGESFNPLTMSKNYPYFIITQNVGYSPNSEIDGIANYETTTLNNVTGLVKVSNIHLETKATNNEKREIEMLLMQGVIINEN